MGMLYVSRHLKHLYVIYAPFDWLLQSGDVTDLPTGFKRVPKENIIRFFYSGSHLCIVCVKCPTSSSVAFSVVQVPSILLRLSIKGKVSNIAFLSHIFGRHSQVQAVQGW